MVGQGAPIDVAKNSFYRKHLVTADGAVKLLPALTDSALSGTTEFNLEGGVNANSYLVSGATPSNLGFGGGELVGGDLVFYCSGVNLSSTASPPNISVYSAISGASFTEGAMELSHGWEILPTATESGSVLDGTNQITGTGTTFLAQFKPGDDIKIDTVIRKIESITDDTNLIVDAVISPALSNKDLYKPRFYGNEISIYTAHADIDLHTYSEGFDGDKTLGEIKIPGYKVKGPYISLTGDAGGQIAKKLYAGGHYSLTYGLYESFTGETGPTGTRFFQQYFGSWEDGGRESKQTILTGVFGNVDEHGLPRRIMSPFHTNYAHLYIKPLDEDKLDDLWVPLYDFRSGMENIMAFTPYWKWKDIKKLVQYRESEKEEVEYSEDVNPNNTIFDAGLIFATPNVSTFYGAGDSAGLPVNKSLIQISSQAYDDGGQSLNMYHLWSYSKLMGQIDQQYGTTGTANPQYACVGMKNVPYPQVIDSAYCATANNGSKDGLMYTNAALPEINLKFNIKEMDTVPTVVSSKTDNPDDETGIFTDYMCSNLYATPPVNMYAENVYVSGTMNENFDLQFRTLMRNFTVCFSNYPPAENESLDNFLHRGLKQFYSGTTQGKLVVGGMTVFRDEPQVGTLDNAGTSLGADIAKGFGGVATVMPLQTGISNYAIGAGTGGGMVTGTKINIEQARNRIMRFQNASGNTAQGANVMGTFAVPNRDGNPENAIGLANGGYEQSVNIQMDKFVNCKFIFNPMGIAYTQTGATSLGGIHDMCRAYFTEGVISGNTNVESDGANSTAFDEETLSIPIYFPTFTGNPLGRTTWSWAEYPDMWPRYMTLWVTNYRNTNNVTGSTDELEGEVQPWSEYDSGQCKFGFNSDYPVLEGSDKQVNVFVDSINFANFTNSVTNASTRAVGNTQSIVIKDYPMKTPLVTPIEAAAQWQWKKGMLNPSLTDVSMPTYVLLGYDNGPSDFYDSGSTGATQWYQWHGFGAQGFSTMTRQRGATTSSYQSAGAATSVTPPTSIPLLGNWMYGWSGTKETYSDNGQAALTAGSFAASYGNGNEYNKIGTDLNAASLPDNTNAVGEFNFASGSTSTYLFSDGLTQKGFIKFGQTGATQSTNPVFDDGWTKREHPFVAAKIIAIPSEVDGEPTESNVITVDNGGIFDMPLTDEYIIYQVPGGNGGSTNYQSTDTYDYTEKALTGVTWDGLASRQTYMDFTTSTTTAYFTTTAAALNGKESYKTVLTSDYIATGSYYAIVSGGAVKEVIKILDYIVSGGRTSSFDRATVQRGCFGTAGNVSRPTLNESLSKLYIKSIKGVTQSKARSGKNIFIATPDIDCLVNERNLPYLYISPFKYWHWFQLWPGGEQYDGGTTAGYVAPTFSSGSAKAYSGISMMKSGSALTGSTGSTFSERDYYWNSTESGTRGMSAPYGNLWNLEPALTGSFVESNVDYGQGAFSEDTRTGGEVTSRQAFSNRPIAFNLDGLITSKQWGNDDPVVNKLVLAEPLLSSSAVFYGNDYTTVTATTGILSGNSIVQEDVKPYYLWRYFDALPTISNFQVNPAFDLLDRETDLYSLTNENLSAVKFTWDENAEDIWYRMLFVDDKAVYKKYHGFTADAPHCLFYAPLNDKPTDMLAKPTVTFQDVTTDSTGKEFDVTLMGAKARMSPEGLQGYAFDTGLSGTAGIGVLPAQSRMMYLAENWTMIFHITPALYSGTNVQTIFSKGETDAEGQFSVEIDANGHIDVAMASGAAMTSTTVSPRNGITPMMIAVVFEKSGSVPCKLYIDGKLEDYSLTGTEVNDANARTAYIGVGNDGSSDSYYGLLEEIILYGDIVHFPDDTGEYTLDGTAWTEYVGGGVTSQHAKLFLMDYHNIRGEGDDVICSSPTVSWRATVA